MNPNDRQRPRGPGKKKPAVPNVKKNMNDDEEEIKRRVEKKGGGRPNFGGMGMGGMPGMGGGGNGMAFAPSNQMPGPTVNTAPMKAAAAMPTPAKSLWGLNSVPTLPEFHPLERSAVFVANTSVQELASRICNVLRDRSIEASYDDAQAKAKCITPKGVEFRIKL